MIILKLAVEEGIRHFEAIGFKNVLQVKTFPVNDSTFDPDNMKFFVHPLRSDWGRKF